MKNLATFFLLLTIIFSGCSKSKKIAPKLRMEKISTYRLCGFHHVHVYDIKNKIKIDSNFFSYPKTRYLKRFYPDESDEILKWKKLHEVDSFLVEFINDVNDECDVFQFKENTDYKEDDIYFSGVSNFKGFLLLNVDKKKLYLFKYYDLGMPFS